MHNIKYSFLKTVKGDVVFLLILIDFCQPVKKILEFSYIYSLMLLFVGDSRQEMYASRKLPSGEMRCLFAAI